MQNGESAYKMKDLEQQIIYLESKHKDYEDMLRKKDAQLAEQNMVIHKNCDVIQQQQKDTEDLHDELDALVSKVTQLTDDNQRFYDEDLNKTMIIKNLKDSVKYYQQQSACQTQNQFNQVLDEFNDNEN